MPSTEPVVFRNFEYRGRGPIVPAGMFANPIQPGFYPDPAICRRGDDYYLVHSTFAYFPGLPIFHSRDLVNWTLLGHALDRPSQLKLDGADVSEGLFAPGLTYHDGTFYLLCTNVGGGGNFIVTATDPAGPWSEPTFLPEIGGIDPSLFFDDDGRAYVIHNGPPPGDGPLYNGHRGLWLFEFDVKALCVRADTGRNIVNGGVDLAKQPIWIEGPHLIRRGEWVYLIAAEGGTGREHSQVVFRSRSVWGTYEPSSGNPVLTQRDLPADRTDPTTCVGHCDFVQTPAGDWWAVCLACRPFEGDGTLTVLGRETFLLPVDWLGEWPVILRLGEVVPAVVPMPKLAAALPPSTGQIAEFVHRDDFSAPTLGGEWSLLRTPRERWFTTGDGGLRLTPRPVELSSPEQPSLIVRRQQHDECSATITIDAVTGADAGLVALQNGTHYLFVGVRQRDGLASVFVETAAGEMPTLLLVATPPTSAAVKLRIEARGKTYTCSYRTDSTTWTEAARVDGTFLTTAKAGGFVGVMIGPFARTADAR